MIMKKKQTEAFRNFIKAKEWDVSELIGLVDRCADRLGVLQDFLTFWNENDCAFNEATAKGLADILGDVRHDVRLISGELMIDVNKDIAEFKKRRAEEKKKEARINP
jgi:hypothetical protein